MIKKYLIERRSWILLILSLEFLVIFVAFLDTSIPLLPLLYFVFISLIIFVFFLSIRYQKETIFYKVLEERENNLDPMSVPSAYRPFEGIIENSLTKQIDFLTQEASQIVAMTFCEPRSCIGRLSS